MKKTLWSACLVVGVCVAAFAVASAQEKPAAAKPAAGPVMTAQEKAEFAKQVDMFSQLAAAGETQKDPLLLLSAVKLLDQLPFAAIDRPDAKEPGKDVYTRDGLLAMAKECATGDAELLAVIAKMADAPEATAVRGHRRHGDGPGYYYDRRYHHRRFGCEWVRECGRHRCEWRCVPSRHHRDRW